MNLLLGLRHRRRARNLVMVCLLAAATAACGKKGNPLPPLRPVPGRIADLTAIRTRDRITLHFTVPAANVDGTTPAAIDRVDIYRVILPPGALPAATPVTSVGVPAATLPAGSTAAASTTIAAPVTTSPSAPAPPPAAPAPAPPTTPAGAPLATAPGALGQAPAPGRGTAAGAGRGAVSTGPTAATVMADPKNLLMRVAVRRTPPPSDSVPDDPSKPAKPAKMPAAPADTRPESGTAATVVDTVDATAVAGSTRYYLAVPVVGNGRGRPGPASALVAVTLGDLPAAPADLVLKFDETRVIATWTPVTGETFTVLRTGEKFDPATAESMTPEPLSAAEFALPMQFGQPVCLAVRATKVTGAVQAEGVPSAPVCVTPVDHFPPPAPGGLQAVQEGSAVTLIWTQVEAADLAGYVVLRGDGATGSLQPLMRTPIREVTYRDTTAQVGQTYTYAVYAVDSSAAANVSQLSDRQTIVIR